MLTMAGGRRRISLDRAQIMSWKIRGEDEVSDVRDKGYDRFHFAMAAWLLGSFVGALSGCLIALTVPPRYDVHVVYTSCRLSVETVDGTTSLRFAQWRVVNRAIGCFYVQTVKGKLQVPLAHGWGDRLAEPDAIRLLYVQAIAH